MATFETLITEVKNIIQGFEFTDEEIETNLNRGVLEIAGGMQSSLGSFITPPLPNLFTIGTIVTDIDAGAFSTYLAVRTLMTASDTLVFTYNTIEITVTLTGDYSTLQDDIDAELVLTGDTAGDVAVSWATDDLILTCAGTIATDTIVGGLYTDTDTANTTTPTDTAFDAALPYVAMPATFQRNLRFVTGSNGVEIDICDSMIEFSVSYPLMDRSGMIVEVTEMGGNLYYQGVPTTAETLTIHYHRFPIDMALDDDTPDGIPLHLQKPLLVNYACWQTFRKIEDGMEGNLVSTNYHKGLFEDALRTLELSIPQDIRSFTISDRWG